MQLYQNSFKFAALQLKYSIVCEVNRGDLNGAVQTLDLPPCHVYRLSEGALIFIT